MLCVYFEAGLKISGCAAWDAAPAADIFTVTGIWILAGGRHAVSLHA